MTTDGRLPVHLYGTHVGNLRKGRGDDVAFESAPAGIERFGVASTVLSTSLPLGPRDSTTAAAAAFFGGLLPEGRGLANLAAQARCGTADVHAMLDYAGLDVAGALQVGSRAGSGTGSYRPVTDAQIAERFARIGNYALGAPGGGGSITGYQPKTTLARIGNQWLEALDGAPTTHILKPLPPEFVGALHAEAYCLEIGRRCGLTTFASEVLNFAGSPALVVERYDRRVDDGGTVHRIHQEDAAQALGLPWGGDAKFESFPPFRATLKNIAGLLPRRRTVLGGGTDDRERLLAFMTLNVAVGNTDAHAKNFSLLHLPNGRIELAPLYDVLPQVLSPDGQQNLAIGVNGLRFQPSVTLADLVAEGQSWGLEQDRARSVAKETLKQVRYAVEESGAAEVAKNVPLLVANQAKNLLNGKRAAVSAGGPVTLAHLLPVSAMPKNTGGRRPGN
ncbi:hypothetical protein AOC05_06510 [Arthrobacter alpinus]|uniref:Serine/threonine-protein kinase HipA n=1 Tax=Arthrobacter alpinus TaxID=656366 RepID=A0A0M4QM39_9MICC|nr:HipA domain-containing protein [Arthrobacter alpinus]ALE92060.1 hypothetical protein AOC05_06510 [Arthrobacter alpinus]